MRFESRTALTLMRLQQAEDEEKITHIRAELEAIRLHLKARREEKYSPDQPRDEVGRWTNGGGGAAPGESEQPDQGREPFGTAPDGATIETIAGIPDSEKGSTVQSFMSRYCNAGIRAEMPGQFLNMNIAEVMLLAKQGDAAARTCLKLLGRGRFQK